MTDEMDGAVSVPNKMGPVRRATLQRFWITVPPEGDGALQLLISLDDGTEALLALPETTLAEIGASLRRAARPDLN